jgi:GT2 family glycosyltransferase
VLIVAFNSGAHLQKALDGLAAQTMSDFEVVVWDNDSIDGAAVAASLPANARLVRSTRNLGFAGGCNAAARETRGELIALLNPDAAPEPTWLERLVAALDAEPKASMAASVQLAADKVGVLDGVGDVYHVSGVCYRGGFGPCGAAALYRRAAFESAGGFDERFFCYVEDVDLAFRLRLLGGTCVLAGDAVVRHVGSASTGRRSEFTVYHGVRNRLWTAIKNVPAPLLPLTLTLHVGVLAIQLLKAPSYGPEVVRGTWRAIRDGVRGAPRFWADRRALHTARLASTLDIARAMTWSPLKLVRRAPDVRPLRTSPSP